MKSVNDWAVGVDLGGTKVNVALVEAGGQMGQRLHFETNVKGGPHAVIADIAKAVRSLKATSGSSLLGAGVGLAGQIDPGQGIVTFAPNLGWHDEPFQADLIKALGLPVVVTNDVRAATWGEWFHGAGKGCNDLICLFVGTGIGGGVVSGGQILTGCSNTAGELGHMVIDLDGPPCTCGDRGCLEALASGWAIAREAKEAVSGNPSGGTLLLNLAGGDPKEITARMVAQAFQAKDPLAGEIVNRVSRALIVGAVSIVNAFNPCRLVLGGGIIEGFPELIDRIAEGVHKRALRAATGSLQVLPAKLGTDAGVIGAATLALLTFKDKSQQGG